MTGNRWETFMRACYLLREFIKKYRPNGTADLSKFDIEYTLNTDTFKRLIPKVIRNNLTPSESQMFSKEMDENLKVKEFSPLAHSILEYEVAIMFINPPPPKPWPQVLFDNRNIDLPEDEILDFLDNYPAK